MKNNKGITLMSLVVAIVILFILSSITLTVGIDSYDVAKVQNFIAEMKVIQAKVDNITEQTDDVSTYGFTQLSDMESLDAESYQTFCQMVENPDEYNINTNDSWNNELDGNSNNYYYFKDNDLEKIGLKGQEITVIINFKTRNIIAKKGVKRDGKMYYRQYDLGGGEQLMEK